jgi:SAM-dependent methyltransferase
MPFQQRWARVCATTIGTDRFWRIAVDHRSAYASLAPLIERYSGGVVVDAGAGRLAWRSLLARSAQQYIPVDYQKTDEDIRVLCDVVSGLPFASDSIDTIFCCSVLEHLRDPIGAMAEFARVLKPGGRLILSVPFMYYLHGAPADFFRFTRYGVALMAEKYELKLEVINPAGGLAHTILQAVSMAFTSMLGSSAFGLSVASYLAGGLWRLARIIDRLDRDGRFAQNINAVCFKELSHEAIFDSAHLGRS